MGCRRRNATVKALIAADKNLEFHQNPSALRVGVVPVARSNEVDLKPLVPASSGSSNTSNPDCECASANRPTLHRTARAGGAAQIGARRLEELRERYGNATVRDAVDCMVEFPFPAAGSEWGRRS